MEYLASFLCERHLRCRVLRRRHAYAPRAVARPGSRSARSRFGSLSGLFVLLVPGHGWDATGVRRHVFVCAFFYS